MREFNDSLQNYELLLKENPDSSEKDFLEFRVAQSLFHLNDFRQSRAKFQKLIEKHSESELVPRARYEIGNTYFMEGRYTVSVEALKQVLRNHSRSPYAVEAQFLMGQCYDHLMRPKDALRMYEGLKGRYNPQEVLDQRIKKAKKKSRRRG